ncbi:MAG: hypothetical protein KZQ64_07020 [gamma proteobacterium symbiont of Bathyaustriella thionipta]|nr:hypothetical protein [gamma proteobacterium symbiont of Bathyaustriella thionipta]MCU7951207.1 hypothetical protein [gamma proteobacterium symbiont of Bathyaustriella thionipta]MCU7953125.1 hypothetical protein [gamma proteobacterium symbiont of Bathyaustriella thionipta]MCU7957720.1 hypothetical protein [gamma proteobacterium symbiont of Bathyaustriella thionipta]MCU7967215.1 hypothetical protein [gamma proteobacterium symbiont of Bathyaustriella thionipta]
MARINLLNWREEKRKQIEQQFYTMLAAAAIVGVAVVFAVQLQLVPKHINFDRLTFHMPDSTYFGHHPH